VDTVPPTVRLTVGAVKQVGSPVRISLQYTDTPPGLPAVDGSGIASVVLDWGDRTTAHVGHNSSHRYARPGLYMIRVTVSDNAGNVTHLSRWIRVKPKPKPKRKPKPKPKRKAPMNGGVGVPGL
jgi:hypothetical protein